MNMDMNMDMDSAGSSLFRNDNMYDAEILWYLVLAVIIFMVILRIIARVQRWRSLNGSQELWLASLLPRTPGVLKDICAALLAIAREVAYKQPIHFGGPVSQYLSPLPLGHWLLICVHWTVILLLLWHDVILSPSDALYAYRWEKVGFRAAWVSLAQVPLIYLLSTKVNPISILTGISYERMNWLHRWTARTLFLTAIVHWSFFFHEWDLADFVSKQLEMMPMVTWGFAAWGVLGWTALSSFRIFRTLCYELFVFQHIISAGVFLWLLYIHVPKYARHYIYLAIAFIAFDWSIRICWSVYRNVRWVREAGRLRLGFTARLQAFSGDMVRVNINDIDFSWKAGQHVYLLIPMLRPFELHPFTIAEAPKNKAKSETLILNIRARKGFTKSLLRKARSDGENGRTCRVLLSGPWGRPPAVSTYQTLLLISTGSGASFAVPILQEIIRTPGTVTDLHFHWIIRHEEHLRLYEESLCQALLESRGSNINVKLNIHITRDERSPSKPMELTERGRESKDIAAIETSSQIASTASSMELEDLGLTAGISNMSSVSIETNGRPSVSTMIRRPVELAHGETAVVVCGNAAISADVRNFIAYLSDERAVNKGTGAKGIFLHVETFGW